MLVEYLRSRHGRRAIHQIARGTNGTWKISQDSFLGLRLPHLQPRTEELADSIAMRLDAHLNELCALVEAKREFKRGLAQQLLTGQKRFPEFLGKPWIEVPLSRFFVEKSKINSSRKESLVYSCTKTVGIIPQGERFGKRLASEDLGRYKIVESGDLVYDPMLLWDGSIGFVPEGGRGVVSPAYESFTVREEANHDYFWVLLKSYNLLHLYKRISKGTNTRRKKAHPSDFLRLTVPMPPTKEEQDRIASVLSAAQSEIDLLTAQRENYVTYKRGLLARLLSGELPVAP